MSPAQIHQIVRQCRPWARLKFYAAFWVTTTTHASTRSQSGLRVTLLRLWHLRGAAKIFFKNFTLCVNVWKIPPPLTSNQYQMLSNIKNPTEEKVRFTHQIFLVSPPPNFTKSFYSFFWWLPWGNWQIEVPFVEINSADIDVPSPPVTRIANKKQKIIGFHTFVQFTECTKNKKRKL